MKHGLWLAGLLTLGLATGCSADQARTSGVAAAQAAPAVHYVGQMTLSPDQGTAGTTVTVHGQGMPAGARLQVVWNTASGAWKLTGTEHETFSGRTFTPVAQALGAATADAQGAFTLTFRAPHDFGFAHDVTVMQAGAELNKAAFDLMPTLTISPTSGPVGTPITVTLDGVGYQYLYNSWFLAYDNKFTGWMSSVTTGGRAVAVIPATGAPGTHMISAVEGAFTFPYLNTQQSPAPKPTFAVPFTVTSGAAVLPPAATSQGLPSVPGTAPAGTGKAIWTDPASGQVGQPATVHGQGFAPGSQVQLTWGSVVGNRVGGQGWSAKSAPLGTATAGADGTFTLPFTVPDDLGGTHAIAAGSATASFTLTPSAFAISPASGPVGTPISIHLKGGGWTATSNIYTVVYDDANLGYVCAFNSQGDIQFTLPAAGEPGYHYIDLYPGIYNGTDIQGVDNFRVPQLTFAQDHPGERLPAFHFAFLVTQ
jgi:hypothetical protein